MAVVGIVAFDGVDDLDLVGVRSVLIKSLGCPDQLNRIETVIVADTDKRLVTSASGLMIQSQADWSCVSCCDAIVLPGGATAEQFDPPNSLQEQLRYAVKSGTPIYCVCSGAFILAKSGLAVGRRLAVHSRKRKALEQQGRCRTACGLLSDGTMWTIGGDSDRGGVKGVEIGFLVLSHFNKPAVGYVESRMELNIKSLGRMAAVA